MNEVPEKMVRGWFSKAPNPFSGKWNWWYSSIADLMIANPDWHLKDIAARLNRHPNTIGLIVKTDLFQNYLAQRKREWRERHDFAIISKTTKVLEKSLDLMLESMNKKREQIPFGELRQISESALDRLGYSPKSTPQVQVNNYGSGPQQVLVPVGKGALEEARDIMRRAEEQRAIEAREREALPPPPSEEEVDDPLDLTAE